jgi:acetyl esterase/lipase
MRRFFQRHRSAFSGNVGAPSKPLRFMYKWVDDEPIATDVYLPMVDMDMDIDIVKPSPVLIMIHGGAFMIGDSKMNSMDQIEDCLGRGWIVVAIEHRLCPGINILEGPMTDVRDALAWIQSGGLTRALEQAFVMITPDVDRVMAMGTSSGGHLALSLV